MDDALFPVDADERYTLIVALHYYTTDCLDPKAEVLLDRLTEFDNKEITDAR